MGAFWDAALAVICVSGLAFVGWWIFGLLLRPLPGREAKVVISGRGEGEKLEQQVRSFLWLRALGLLRCPIVIADAGLTPAGWALARGDPVAGQRSGGLHCKDVGAACGRPPQIECGARPPGRAKRIMTRPGGRVPQADDIRPYRIEKGGGAHVRPGAGDD